MNLTVVTTVLNEPYLARTVESVWRACDDDRPEILVVEDGVQELARPTLDGVRFARPWSEPRGCMAARDWGLVSARHDACVVVDAHMDFEPGLFASFAIRLRREPDALLCPRCRPLDPTTWAGTGVASHGAWVVWRRETEETVPLDLAWQRTDPDGEETSAVLGACYGLCRRWYVDGLRRPWRFGTGWGTDEQLLSIANWLCGGTNRLMPCEVGHWFRPVRPPHPGGSAVAALGRWSNRIRLLRLLPMPAAWRQELESIAWENRAARLLKLHIELRLFEEDFSGYREFLAAQDRSFEAWRERWCLEREPVSA